MNKEDLDALSGLYESVYLGEESQGHYLTEIGVNFGGQAAVDRARKEQKAKFTSDARLANLRTQRFGSGGSPSAGGSGGTRYGSSPTPRPAATPATPAPRPAATAPRPAATAPRPAATPATPAARPATPGTGAKVSPSSAAKPAATSSPSTSAANATTAQKVAGGMKVYAAQKKAGDVKGAEETGKATWAAANQTLADKPKTRNPLMDKTFGYQTGNAPDQIKKADAAFARSKETANKLGISGSLKSITSGYEWPSAKTIRDIAGAYASIYEAKKKDQDKDGDNDFADVRIARMIASGMSKAEAIAAVKDKEYNEEFESWLDSLIEEGYDLSDYTMEEMFDSYLEEATRMRKELGKEGEIATRKELAARSKAYKRSGSVDKTIAAAERGADRPYIKHKRDESEGDRTTRERTQSKTLRGLASARRKSVRGEGGLRGYAAKVEGDDKDLQSVRGSARSAGTLTPREKKELGEIYNIVSSYLLENNFAETINDANVIIENMSEVWLNEILSEEN
jgi:hypothetical protein